jgi:glycosyltransferase involved in cell wall biosynthesis
MKLLIITQSIDESNPVLGFFTGWVKELAKKFEQVTVICLEEGKHNLPENVGVYSLGKEQFENSNIENSLRKATWLQRNFTLKIKDSKLKIFRRINYMFRFYYLIWKLLRNYDSVFVHMNQEYVILGWKFWKLFNKKIYLWRNHPQGNFFTNISVWVSDKVFCTSPDAYTAKFKKTVLMPVGINTSIYTLESRIHNLESKKSRILFLGRMSPIKRPEILIEALNLLNKDGIDFEANFYGDPLLKDIHYYESLKSKTKEYGLENKIIFHKGVLNEQTPKIYLEHNIFVNLTPSGSMDKTIFEAGLSGCIPIVSNEYFNGIFDNKMIATGEPKDLAEKLKYWISADNDEINKISYKIIEYIKQNHSLDILMEKLTKIIK